VTAHDEARQPLGSLRARFQPLLLPSAAIVVFPAAVSGGAPVWVLALLVLAVVFGSALAVLARSGRFPPRQRERLAVVLTVLALIGFAGVLFLVDVDRPQDFLVVGAALLCALASSPRVALRTGLSLVVFATMAAAMARASLPMLDIAFGLALLVMTATLAQAVATNLRAARRGALQAYDDARDRAELLDTLRGLMSSSLTEAAQVCLQALRGMGIDAAALHRIELGELRVVHMDGFGSLATPPPRGKGLVWRAIDGDRTVASADYRRDAPEVDDRPHVRSAVAVPLREDDEPTGSVVAAWFRPHEPTRREVELIEVLAAHLGGIAAAEDRLARQQELLQRLGMLDRMRRQLLNAMSEELREPLTGLSQAVQELDTDTTGRRLTAAQRDRLLQEVADQTAQLRQLVDTVLDFSRSQGDRPDPGVVPVEIGQVLVGLPIQPVVAAGGEPHDPRVLVVADPYLLRSGLDLLINAGRLAAGTDPEVRVEIDRDDEVVGIVLSGLGTMPALVRSLASQLLATAGGRLVQEDERSAVFVPRVPRAERRVDASTARSGLRVRVVVDDADA
jgi:K+-sensing histidine kinase KdpD